MTWKSFADVQFDFDKAIVRGSEMAKLVELAEFLKQNPTAVVELEAYADPRGEQSYNLPLTQRRVEAVRDALIDAGVEKDNIVTGAYGELGLNCTDMDETCWQQNRRVEVKVIHGALNGAALPRQK